MIVKVPIRIQEFDVDPNDPDLLTGKKARRLIELDVKGITCKIIKYDLDNKCAIIEIEDKDLEKIKDKVIEVIEQ